MVYLESQPELLLPELLLPELLLTERLLPELLLSELLLPELLPPELLLPGLLLPELLLPELRLPELPLSELLLPKLLLPGLPELQLAEKFTIYLVPSKFTFKKKRTTRRLPSHYRGNVAYVDVPMGACVGSSWEQKTREGSPVSTAGVWLMLTSL